MMLAEAALFAPWCGLTEASDSVVHRVNMDGLPMATWETATHATAVCGASVKLIEVEWSLLRTRGTQRRRCTICHPPRKATP